MKKLILFSLTILLLSACGREGRKPGSRSNATEYDSLIVVLTVNVYIENSGSMAGYVKGYSDFKDAVGNFLSDIQISGLSESLNLFFINKKTEKIGSDVNAYLDKLTVSCNAATSDIAQIFQTVLTETDDERISIFVTDGIFSPEKGKNASDYLKLQQKNVKEAVAEHLKKYPQTAISVYQLSSNFDGIYYNRDDTKTKINEQRPYYIWVIGNVENIALLKAHIPDNKFKGGGVQHSYTLLPAFDKGLEDYAILNAPKFGTFERDKKSPKTSIHSIERAKSGEHKGKFMIMVGMNLLPFKVLLGDKYLMNNNSYARLITKETTDTIWHGDKSISHNTTPNVKYTHNLQMLFNPTDKIVTGELKIVLQNNFPQWIIDANDDEGLSAVADKTFGIKYLVEGVYEAYNFTGNTIYTTMKFNLKK
ncbi:MAG: hypothetical protein LBN23_02220 [Paludibacter sp.]|jgi:hypothetical protein|nr:hypothetical protein [Paludibacter sp.]